MKIKNLHFYYGVEAPDFDNPLMEEDGTAIVLQDYHPIVQQGVFGDYFPQAKHYLYWNCCKVARTECTLSEEELTFAQYQPEWDCYLLDLTREAHKEILINRALKLANYFGVDGLFVDDLDSWSSGPDKQKILLLFLDELETKLPGRFTFIFNRGFPFWGKKSDRLAAVLIEDVGPNTLNSLDHIGQQWLLNTLKMHIPLLLKRAPHVSIFFLQYTDSSHSVDFTLSTSLTSQLTALFDTFLALSSISALTAKTRKLDQWPQGFQYPSETMESLSF